MTIRERLGKKNPSPETEQARRKDVPAVVQPVLHCVHRAWMPSGKIKCSCSNQPEVFVCENPWVSSGYCTPTMPVQAGDGPIVMADGSRIDPADNRFRTFMPWPLREGEHPHMAAVVVCSTCPRRADPPPHICRLQKLGIYGNYDSGTGYADIIHAVPVAEHWKQHAADHAASAPNGLRACWMAGDKMPDLEQIYDATHCQMMVLNCYLGKPESVEKAAKALPRVKFVVVFHGTQNYMVSQGEWSSLQKKFLGLSRELPNVWYGTPELTAPWEKLGYERFFVWPNTMPFIEPTQPLPVIDPPALLISGRKEMTKAHPAAVLAAALIAKQRMVKVVAVVKDSGMHSYKDLAQAAGIDIVFNSWRSQIAFRRWIRESVSLTFQGTLTDSFNYLALDSLSQGRPVVGSQTIRYLPREWQADPNDPADIARVACMFLDDYPRYSAEALRLGVEIRDRQAEAYRAAIEHILGS